MEPSKSQGGAEDYSSCESGWTVYIDSIHGQDASYADDVDDVYQSPERRTYHRGKKEDDGESDDSMTSDASSGPSHHLSEGHTKPAASKYSSKQEHHHQQVKEKGQRRGGWEDGEPVVKAKSRTSHVQSGNKVSKSK